MPRVDLSSPEAIEACARQLGVSGDRLQAALAAVGPEVDKLKAWLASPASLDPPPTDRPR